MLSFVKALNAWRAGRRRSEIAVPTKGLAWQKAARGRHSVTRRLRLSASEAGSEKLGRPCPEVRLDRSDNQRRSLEGREPSRVRNMTGKTVRNVLGLQTWSEARGPKPGVRPVVTGGRRRKDQRGKSCAIYC